MGVCVPVFVFEGVCVIVLEAVRLPVCVCVTVCVIVFVGVWVVEGVPVRLEVCDWVRKGVGVTVVDAELEGVVEAVTDFVFDAVIVWLELEVIVRVIVFVLEDVVEGVCVLDAVRLEVIVGDSVPDREVVPVVGGVLVLEGVFDGVFVWV